MVKTNKKGLLVTMLVVLLSAIMLVGGLAISNSKPQIDAKVKATTSTTLKGGPYGQEWFRLISTQYSLTNLLITTDDGK